MKKKVRPGLGMGKGKQKVKSSWRRNSSKIRRRDEKWYGLLKSVSGGLQNTALKQWRKNLRKKYCISYAPPRSYEGCGLFDVARTCKADQDARTRSRVVPTGLTQLSLFNKHSLHVFHPDLAKYEDDVPPPAPPPKILLHPQIDTFYHHVQKRAQQQREKLHAKRIPANTVYRQSAATNYKEVPPLLDENVIVIADDENDDSAEGDLVEGRNEDIPLYNNEYEYKPGEVHEEEELVDNTCVSRHEHNCSNVTPLPNYGSVFDDPIGIGIPPTTNQPVDNFDKKKFQVPMIEVPSTTSRSRSKINALESKSVSRDFEFMDTKLILRPIIIDGRNIALEHGHQKSFSCLGIDICVDYFKSRGHSTIIAFLPELEFKKNDSIQMQPSDLNILNELNETGILKFTPNDDRSENNNITSSAYDRCIVQAAFETGGAIISNEYFSDVYDDEPLFRDVIHNRVLPFIWSRGILIIPEKPFGPNGPSLEQLLSL